MKKLALGSTTILLLLSIGFYVFYDISDVFAKNVWEIECTENAEQGKMCWMKQELYLNQEKDGETKAVGKLLTVTISSTGSNEKPVMLMSLPLGVNLQAGVTMQVDQDAAMQAPYEQCIKKGCIVRSALTEEILEKLKKGSNLRVSVLAIGSKKTLDMKIDLTGFSNALKKIEASAG